MTRKARLAERCVRSAVRLYPDPFRQRFGTEIAAAFVERLRLHRARHGRLRTALFALRALLDIAAHGRRERRLARDRASLPGRPRSDRRWRWAGISRVRKNDLARTSPSR